MLRGTGLRQSGRAVTGWLSPAADRAYWRAPLDRRPGRIVVAMGVGGFQKWMAARYPSAYVSMADTRVDHLYLDMSSLLHTVMRNSTAAGPWCTVVPPPARHAGGNPRRGMPIRRQFRGEGGGGVRRRPRVGRRGGQAGGTCLTSPLTHTGLPVYARYAGKTMDDFSGALFVRLNFILQVCKPTKSVVLAMDGPAPLAKLLTQRSRRKVSDLQRSCVASGCMLGIGIDKGDLNAAKERRFSPGAGQVTTPGRREAEACLCC